MPQLRQTPDNPFTRRIERLLRALARTDSPAVVDADGGVRIEVRAGAIVRFTCFDAGTVAEAARRDLVELAAGIVRATAAGRAALARAADPQHAFLAQHCHLSQRQEEADQAAGAGLVDETESPLGWLWRRRGQGGESLLSASAFQAGERLRADFTRASLTPRMTASWDTLAGSAPRPDGGMAYSDVAVAARQRVHRALDAVGPELAGILLDVCCFLKGLEAVERERRWPARSAKVVLCIALERLAGHYGLSAAAVGPDRTGSVRRWTSHDARGSIAARASLRQGP